MMNKTVTYDPATHRIVPVAHIEEFLSKREQDTYSCGLLVKDLRAMLAAAPDYPESEPTDRDLRIAEAVRDACKNKWDDGAWAFDAIDLPAIIASVGGKPAEPKEIVNAAKERDVLAEGIYDAAVAVGIIQPGTSLSGPQLLLILQNLSSPVEPVNKRRLEACDFVPETAPEAFLQQEIRGSNQPSTSLLLLHDARALIERLDTGEPIDDCVYGLRRTIKSIAASEQAYEPISDGEIYDEITKRIGHPGDGAFRELIIEAGRAIERRVREGK